MQWNVCSNLQISFLSFHYGATCRKCASMNVRNFATIEESFEKENVFRWENRPSNSSVWRMLHSDFAVEISIIKLMFVCIASKVVYLSPPLRLTQFQQCQLGMREFALCVCARAGKNMIVCLWQNYHNIEIWFKGEHSCTFPQHKNKSHNKRISFHPIYANSRECNNRIMSDNMAACLYINFNRISYSIFAVN